MRATATIDFTAHTVTPENGLYVVLRTSDTSPGDTVYLPVDSPNSLMARIADITLQWTQDPTTAAQLAEEPHSGRLWFSLRRYDDGEETENTRLCQVEYDRGGIRNIL